MTANGLRGSTALNNTSTNVDGPSSCNIKGFHVVTRKLPILKSGPHEAMGIQLGIAPPEMNFGDNIVAVEHPASKWGIKFDGLGALDRVDKTGEKRLKVAYSREWYESRADTHDIKEVIRPFDWSYTTDYKGDVAPDGPQFQESDTPIPIDVLRRRDPILLFANVPIYEDELADNGISTLSVKIRVMPSGLFVLSRFFMRLDNVLLRLRDTRVYIDFDAKKVIREYVARENNYEAVRVELAARREDVAAEMDSQERMAEILPITEKTLESVSLVTRPEQA